VIDTVHAFVGEPRVLATGPDDGPLAGTTLAVKDVIDVAGTVTGAGNPDFAAGRAPAAVHAGAVRALVGGGATVVGKTITDELAWSLAGTNAHFGTPVNVAAPGRIPGGSSAGSAAAVAAGLCDLALGTDTGGSVRVPASYCGLVGWRPSHGAVDTTGVVHLARSFDTVGLFARSAGLLLAAAELLLERHPSGAVRSAALVTELVGLVDDEARRSVSSAVDADEVALGLDLATCADAFRTIQGREAWAEHGEWIARVHPAMGPGVAGRFEAASHVTAEEAEAAHLVRDEVRRVVAEATAGGRVLVGPAAAGAAPTPEDAAGLRARTLQLTCVAGLAGAPVVVLPLAQDDGLPLGVACMGAPGSDLALLRWAADRLAS